MDTTSVSALAGVLGSLAGGSVTIGAALIGNRQLSRRDLVRSELRKREELYGEFIDACGKLLFDALTNTLEKPETLLPAYVLISRIRLFASDKVLAQAELLLKSVADQYFSANLTLEQLRELARSEDHSPLRAFGEACRAELAAMRTRLA